MNADRKHFDSKELVLVLCDRLLVILLDFRLFTTSQVVEESRFPLRLDSYNNVLRHRIRYK